MKRALWLLVFWMVSNTAIAEDLLGGEIYYSYAGPGSSATSHLYTITLKLYKGTTAGTLPAVVPITVFRALSGASMEGPVYAKKYGILDGPYDINYFSLNPCISPPVDVRFQYALYTVTVDLQESSYGYVVAYQRCCREPGIKNLDKPAEQGVTYFTTIPGLRSTIPRSVINSSPKFSYEDTAVICQFSRFTLDCSATDADGDLLKYQFASAYKGGDTIKDGVKCNQFRPDPACMPFKPCIYLSKYDPSSPMGLSVTIDPVTGIVSGIAPGAGKYVVVVMCYETRDNIIIGEHYKEFLVSVSADCAAVTAHLDPMPVICNSFTVNFNNNALNDGLNLVYQWDFGEPSSGAANISALPTPAHTYAAPGDYKVKLRLSLNAGCTDSSEITVKVYPGFQPDFEIIGQCKNTPVQFNDKTQTSNGTIVKWEWDFGDIASGFNNKSTQQHPTHVFATPQDYTVMLKTTSSKGCVDNVSKTITIKDVPEFVLYPKDTLICNADTLQVGAVGYGTVLWSPNYMISSLQFQAPLVSPDITTVYKVAFTDTFGCVATDSIKINVTDRVYQGSNYDTVICEKDPVVLRLSSNALYYHWIPDNGTLNNSTIKNPTVTLGGSTSVVYRVTGKISDKCVAQNDITVTPVPYPVPVAADVQVCAGASAQLQASGGSIYSWSPGAFLNSTTIPNPVAVAPSGSVRYTVTVRDVLGCPKPVQKTVRLNVIKIIANAGPRDTSVVLNQPLQLHASGSTNYLWLPDNRWLNNTRIANPVALPQDNIEYIVQVSDSNGCAGSDSIRVTLYRVAPGLYVPNAFTPNGDGRNDLFRPILLGIQSLDLFQVYNRFGQLLYSSTNQLKGWDGKLGGRVQDAGSYLWIARATDYTGKKILRQGTVILIPD